MRKPILEFILFLFLALGVPVSGQAQQSGIPPQQQTGIGLSLTCPSCPVMETVFKGALKLTDAITRVVAKSLQALVAAMLGVWLLLQAGKLLFPFGPLDRVPNLLNSVTGMILLSIAVLFVLTSPELYKRYILHPIIDTSIRASNVILQQAVSVGSAVVAPTPSRNPTAAQTGLAAGILQGVQNSGVLPPGTTPVSVPVATAGALQPPTAATGSTDFETQMTKSLLDHVKVVQQTLQKGICLGISSSGLVDCMNKQVIPVSKDGQAMLIEGGIGLIDAYTRVIQSINNPTAAGANIIMLLWGKFTGSSQKQATERLVNILLQLTITFVIIIIYGMAWLKYPLYVLDVVMKWAIISILWPFMAAAMMFPATRPAAFTALKGLAHAGLTLIFMAAVVGTSLSVVDQLWNELNAAGGVTLNNKTIGHPDYWVTVITGLLILYLMNQCPRMAGAFIDSSMDVQVAEGLWVKFKDLLWQGADIITAGKAGRFKRILNIK